MRSGMALAILVAALTAVAAGCGGNQRGGGAPAGASEGTNADATRGNAGNVASIVTLRHPPTGFSIEAPGGFSLVFRRGVYVLKNGTLAMSFSRSVTDVTPKQFGNALLRQLGGTVVAREVNSREFGAQLDRGRRREAFVVARDGSQLAVTTSSSPISVPVSLGVLRRTGASARGGVALRAPRGDPCPSR